MSQIPGSTFDERDFNLLLTLVERYTLSTVIAALSRICLRSAARNEVLHQAQDSTSEWRKDASILTKALIQLKH
ncbi:hypothetical protein [Leptolyngbya sp. FACHB-261]|uniref:hypothetical protein n=1 Tax=Leptolyngbya sp. FACHB-261 TaxID=2692806 RepID=UPI00168761ED|nr:hypothetical protein [Leptolyngbya sp. FACHB-261]MBD2104722.1 hypothetical protein [Leptolyngbya sp. FACHB-261]